MIPDWLTNAVFLSAKLERRHPQLWRDLQAVLAPHGIPVHLLRHTRDIWVRDFLPVQTGPDRFVKFRYEPDYLEGNLELRTPEEIVDSLPIVGTMARSSINLDGGNVIASEGRVFLTDKIYKENRSWQPDRLALRRQLALSLGGPELIVIGKEPYDAIGHSDGVVRFLDNDLVVVNDYRELHPSYAARLETLLARHRLRFGRLPYFPEDYRGPEGIDSAVGNYVNFLRIGNLIVLPAYETPQDDEALKALAALLPEAEIVQLVCTDLARDGGVLNCISWNVQLPPNPNT